MLVDSLHVTRTYGGCLEGHPSRESVFAVAHSGVGKMWGIRPTLLMEPVEVVKGELPPWVWSVWLTDDPINEEWCGSELVVVWFSDQPPGSPVDWNALRRSIDWKQHARDFDY